MTKVFVNYIKAGQEFRIRFYTMTEAKRVARELSGRADYSDVWLERE